MTNKKNDKTFIVIIITAAVIAILSVAVCVFMIFMPDRVVTVDDKLQLPAADTDFVSYYVPSEDKYCSGEERITVSVCAKNGSTAYVMLAGQKIPLYAASQSLEGNSVLSGEITLPSAQAYAQELGNVAFFVTYNGITQICYGGKLTVGAEIGSPDITVPQQPQSQVTESVGTGTAKAIVVTGPLTEGKDVTSTELFYNPTYGNLVTSMTDYVVQKIIDYDDDGKELEFYKLMSGRAVPADSNVALIDVNENMTYNSVSLSSVREGNSNKIVIAETMKVPYKLNYVGQTFVKGYEKLSYNVKPFCAQAVDFIFDYTVAFNGDISSFNDEVISSVTASINPDNKTFILHCVLRRPGKFYGYDMSYDSSGNLNLSFRQPVRSYKGLSVTIDAGHGGNPGALDYTGKYHEADQTLAISNHLAAYLSNAGAVVYMTRTANNEVSLETRRFMNQQIKPDLFISIHLNAAENKSRSGTSTYYFTPFSQPLASCINNRLVSIFSQCYRDNPDMLKNVNGGDRYYPFFVTRTDVCPSVLVEVGFITHALESKYLIDPAYHQAFGKAIFDAVGDYLALM